MCAAHLDVRVSHAAACPLSSFYMLTASTCCPQAMYQQQGEGEEIVIGRPQMQQSIKVLLEKTQLESMPNSKAAVQELRSISSIAGEGQGPLAGRELKDIARAYNRARDALRLVFESFSEAERDECKQIFRQMQAQDRARLESA